MAMAEEARVAALSTTAEKEEALASLKLHHAVEVARDADREEALAKIESFDAAE